ncbi:MAG: hypothetical protein ACRBM6_23110 [Geminicoccales bacterium]
MSNFDAEIDKEIIDQETLGRVSLAFREQLTAAGLDLKGPLGVDAYIDQFDNQPVSTPYNDVPLAIWEICDAIVTLGGEQALDVYHRLVLLELMGRFEQRVAKFGLPSWLEGRVMAYFQSMIRDVQKPRPYRYDLKRHDFLVDLGVCRIKLWPCGAELVDAGCSLHLRWLLQKREIAQSIRALIHIGFSVRGTVPVLVSHFDKRRPAAFSLEGYRELYLDIARLLREMPDHLGLLSPSWWHDPAVGRVSPQLAFLNTLPMSGGARIYRIGTDETAIRTALRLSKKRTEAYRKGTYHPAFYHLIWARNDLLRWAEAQGPTSRCRDNRT